MTNASFSIGVSRQYWRFAPSGEGKHDTAQLSRLPDGELENIWDRALSARLLRYPEEDCFIRTMAPQFAGKRILSIGSGLGFHEIFYQRHDADVTCCDIVPSNLEIVRRTAQIKKLKPIKTVLLADSTFPVLKDQFDIGFIYGSLMTMPGEQQRQLLARVKDVLTPGGSIVLMLYTWRFAATTCGWTAPEQFDPVVFARKSDPSVGEEHCPWSDWHDDVKILDLTGHDMRIAHRQLWQNDLFVWYSLEFGKAGAPPTEYFDRDGMLRGSHVSAVPLDKFKPQAAKATSVSGGLRLDTQNARFGYALASPVFKPHAGSIKPNALRADITLLSGGLSLGVLDVTKQVFLNTAVLADPGRQSITLAMPPLSGNWQLIFSNHRPDKEASSSFVVHGLELVRRDSVADDLKRCAA